MLRCVFVNLFLVASVSCGVVAVAEAQPQTTDADVVFALVADAIQAKLTAAESSTEFTDAQRARILDVYRQILAEIEKKKTLRAAIAQYTQDAVEVPKRIEDIKAEIAAVPKEVALDPEIVRALEEIEARRPKGKDDIDTWLTLAADTLKQMELQLGTQRTELDVAKKAMDVLEDEPKRRANRRLSIPKEIAAVNERIATLRKEADQPPGVDEPIELTEARNLLFRAQQEIASLEIDRDKRELVLYDAAEDLLPLRHDLAQRKAGLLEQGVKLWGSEVDRLRKRIVDQQARSAVSKATDVASQLSELSEIATANVQITKARSELETKIKTARAQLDATTKQLESLEDEFERLQRQVGGRTSVTEAVGVMLRKNRQELPDVRKRRAASRERKDSLYDIRFAQIENEERLWGFNDFDARIQSELDELAKTVSPKRLETLQPELVELFKARQLSLDGLKTDLNAQLDILTKLDVQEDSLITITEQYSSFVDQRVLWIRSVPPISWVDFADSAKSASWLLAWQPWSALGKSLLSGIQQQPVQNMVFVLFFLGLIGYRSRFRRRIPELGELAESGTCRNFRITLEAATFAFVRAGLWPLFLGWLAWNLYKLPDSTELARPVAVALHTIALVLFPLVLWLRIVRRRGLADSHFDWSDHNLRALRYALRWLIPILVPSVALFHIFHAADNLVYDKSAARFAFQVATISLAVFVQRIVSPETGLLKEYIGTHRGAWIDQLRFLWHPLLVATPLAFAVLSLCGFQYTAGQLVRRFYVSAAFLSGMYLMSAIVLRWIKISRRSLAIEKARERLAALSIGDDPEQPQTESIGGVTVSGSVDLSAVNLQSRRMLNSFAIAIALLGLYFIWVGVLPALAKLDDVRLWQTSIEVLQDPMTSSPAIVAVSPQGATAPAYSPPTEYKWVTLANLIGTVVIVVLTLVATQNVPGFMEIALLQRLPLDASLRYAITTVTRYVIMLSGAAWALGNIGIGWGKVQWLVAAVSVGLGFGLQEIFANFISGLILLFERPLRAGDIVTVGEVTGKVVQIKTRATTIQDWDRKELIVPNKEFITGRVLNWTLSDTVNRIVIVVGIAYGSNLKEARRVILKVAQDHPLVVDDPQPSVTFELFGDSTLNFTLRGFILLANMDKRLTVVHELNEAIHDRLHEVGIEIAFPQRDLHIRSVSAPFAIANEAPREPVSQENSPPAKKSVRKQESPNVKHTNPKEN